MPQTTCSSGLQWAFNVYVEAMRTPTSSHQLSPCLLRLLLRLSSLIVPFCVRVPAQLVLGERWPHCARAPSDGDASAGDASAGDASAGGASGSEGQGEAVHSVSGVAELGSIVAAMVGMAQDGHGLARAHAAGDQAHAAGDQADGGAPADDAAVEAAGGAEAMGDE